MDTPENKPRGVRFPDSIRRRISEIAKREHRSFGAQVVWICEDYLRGLEAEPLAPKRAPQSPARPAEPTKGRRAS